jgi:hypothetical protein
MSDKQNAKDLIDAWEPFEALMPLFKLEDQSEARTSAVNDALVADLFGDAPVAPPPSRFETETLNLMYAILHIYSSQHRLGTYKKMFKYYPWKNRISKAEHIQATYYLVVHECYIFEERLKWLLQSLGKFAKKNRIDCDMKLVSRTVMKLYQKTFQVMLRWRGQHVHEDEFVPREIGRIGLLGTFVSAEELGFADSNGSWRRLQTRAMNQARKQWITHCDDIERAMTAILALTFRRTKVIWSKIAEIQGKQILSSHK